MKKLTEMQQAFAVNKAAGLKNREAAIAAGYSAKNPDVQAAMLLRRADIKAAIKAAKKELAKGVNPGGVEIPEVEDTSDKNKMPKAKYTDAKDFLLDAMNHKHLPIAARADYAKALLPYQHARIGETGKKEKLKDRANAVAGKGKGKFSPKAPPSLKVVGGKG